MTPLAQGSSRCLTPGAGEAVVGNGAVGPLNLQPGLGRIRYDNDPAAEPIAVVGVCDATGPLAHLADTVLISTEPENVETLRYLYVMANDITVVDRLEQVVRNSTPVLNPAALTLLLTLLTSAPIATFTAYRDPLRILRVP